MRLLSTIKRGVKRRYYLTKRISGNVADAYSIIRDFGGDKQRPTFSIIPKRSPIVDLMIVVPVYNCAPYLNECIQSIILQRTKYSFIVVFVDDGSSDESADILDAYNHLQQVKVIHQPNRGISCARNRAILENYGKYILFVDGDDVLQEGAVESLLKIGFAEDADIVEGQYDKFKDNVRISKCDINSSHRINSTDLSGYAWGKIIKAELVISNLFPEKYVYEDTIMSTLLQPMGKVCYKLDNVVYHYRDNLMGLDNTTVGTTKVIDTFWMTKYCFEENVKRGISWLQETELMYLKQIKLNSIRMQACPLEVKKAAFLCYSQLFSSYWLIQNDLLSSEFKMLKKSLINSSYLAYSYILSTWDE